MRSVVICQGISKVIHRGNRLVDSRVARPSSVKHEVQSADTLRGVAGDTGALALSEYRPPCSRFYTSSFEPLGLATLFMGQNLS